MTHSCVNIKLCIAQTPKISLQTSIQARITVLFAAILNSLKTNILPINQFQVIQSLHGWKKIILLFPKTFTVFIQ